MACEVCMGINSRNCPVCGEKPQWMQCPGCGGYGVTECTAYNIVTGEKVDVTPTAYVMLPDDEDIARYKRQNYCKGEYSRCSLCGGEGVIYAVPDAI